MDNISRSEPDSHKREPDLKIQQASCLLHLRGSSALKWGIRKRVSYLPNKLKEVKAKMSLLRVESESESMVGGGRNLKGGMAESVEEERSVFVVKSPSRRKRMKGDSSGSSERRSKKIAGRWSVQRCESAKKALLEVVKEMEATWQNPVLRYDLRAKARKHIGDTGLLDHLLRHMAGQVFPDGKERLVRRHNSEGAIQYWLEPAEMAEIRREAGISDPYWIPPPGWKPGDAILDHMCDGHCNRQIINVLKMEIAGLKETTCTAIAELKETLKNQQEEICLLKEENEKRRQDKLAMKIKETCIASSEKLVQEEVMVKQVVAGDEVGTMEKTAQKSAFRICQPEGTFLWPDMGSTGVTSFSPHFVTSATSPPLLPVVLPSPTSPLPPQLPDFFCQQQTNNSRQVYSFSPAQSKGVFVASPGQGTIHWPTARYASLPHDMMNSGANASNRVECGALTSVMAPAMNSGKTDTVMTDLTLGSYNYQV